MNKKVVSVVVLSFIFVILAAWSQVHCLPYTCCPWKRDCGPKPQAKKVTLTFVGAWDTAANWKDTIEQFRQYEIQKRNLEVNVQYEALDKDNYEDILLDRQINKKAPNIFMMLNTWLSRYKERVVEMPQGKMSMSTFEGMYPQVAKDDVVSDGKIYSLPVYIDTLGLFYNKDIFINAGYIKPPETWDEFVSYVEKLTQFDQNGKIKRLGATVGGSDSVNRSQDILMLMVMQNNVKAKQSKNLVSFRTPEAERAVKFYTDFANPSKKFYTWDYNDKTYSIDAFTQGRAAMSINYSYEIADIQNKTRGGLNYAVATVPQQYSDDKTNLAYYWTPVVSKEATCIKEQGVAATCQDLSWDFIHFVSQGENAKLYLESTSRPAAKLALAEKQAQQEGSKVAPFASQVLTARSWKSVENKRNDQILSDMIDLIITTDAANKKDIKSAMSAAVNVIKELY